MIEVSVIYNNTGMYTIDKKFTKFTMFPAGEYNVCIEDKLLSDAKSNYMGGIDSMKIKWYYVSDAEFMQVALIVDAIRNKLGNIPIELFVPYFPYARQDRVCNPGEAFGLRVAVDFIKNLNFQNVTVVDPHSNVLQGMFPAGMLRVIEQKEIINQILPDNLGKNVTIVAPAEGSYKKIDAIYKQLSKEYPNINWDMIQCYKKRDLQTGQLVGFDTIQRVDFYGYANDFIVFDDICDGGRTFIELIKKFEYNRVRGAKFHLCVTHGIFNKGVDVLYEAGYDSVSFYNDMSE